MADAQRFDGLVTRNTRFMVAQRADQLAQAARALGFRLMREEDALVLLSMLDNALLFIAQDDTNEGAPHGHA